MRLSTIVLPSIGLGLTLLSGPSDTAPPRHDESEEARFCSIDPPIQRSKERTRRIVRTAETVVRVRALGAVTPAPPADQAGQPHVQFEVLERLGRTATPDTLVFFGWLDDHDSFSEESIPYLSYYRWQGGGECFATSYRAGAEYLLILSRPESTAALTPYWALAPMNEQVRGPTDPGVEWVRNERAAAFLADELRQP